MNKEHETKPQKPITCPKCRNSMQAVLPNRLVPFEKIRCSSCFELMVQVASKMELVK